MAPRAGAFALPAGATAVLNARPAAACRLVPLRRRWRHVARRRWPVSAVAAGTPRQEEEEQPSSRAWGKEEETFEWLDQWYPLAPVCDLDPRAPHGKTVLGLPVVAWFDRAAGEWRVFDDACPHRLAPLSEGRIDGKGRLQCVYHGWCFDGRGACQFIPQAPALGPPVHKNSKACVAAYPSVVQNSILWFYPRSEAEHRDVLQRKRPPFIPQIDDPSFGTTLIIRDLFYGYDVLVENLLDPAHVPYAHKGITPSIPKKEDPGRVEWDREGGNPIKMRITEESVGGFLSKQDTFFDEKKMGFFKFVAPCLICSSTTGSDDDPNEKQLNDMFVFLCIPVAPGRSRVILAFAYRAGAWLNKIIPRWFYHIGQMAVFDSDIYLLHVEERKFAAEGLHNWQKACYVPTSSDDSVIAFRNWFRKYCKNRVGWAKPIDDQLLPTPTRDVLMERYWSHVAQCTSCSAALKAMRALEVTLQVVSVAVVGFLAIGKGTLATSLVQRAVIVVMAVLCFAMSRWLASFIEKNFYFEDYVHAYK